METENILPKTFSNVYETDHYILFFNEDNPTSNDANHAIIKHNENNVDFDKIIKEIKTFYLLKNLPPLIYSNFVPGQLEKIREVLIRNSFDIESNNTFYMIHKGECKINELRNLKIRKISQTDDLSFIYKIFGTDRVYKIIEKKIQSPNFNLFVGYLSDGTPVATIAIEYINGVANIDKVRTSENYRGKGYARQMTKFCVDWHYKNKKDCLLYLGYSNPIAGRIYLEAGFAFVEGVHESWHASVS